MLCQRPWTMLITALSIAGCGAVPYTKAEKPVNPKTDAECAAAGGNWTTLGLPYPNKPKVCDLKAKDTGKPCADSTHCQGICVPPESAKSGDAVVGRCSEYLLNFGNVRIVRDGKVERLYVE